jgi:hypothetical protein
MNKYVYTSVNQSRKKLIDDNLQVIEPPQRPLSASMSNLSFMENKRQLVKVFGNAKDPLTESLNSLKKSKITEFNIKDKEISTMLVRLDRISRNAMYGQKKIELTESEKVIVELLPGEFQFAYVNTRGRACPLNIIIHKTCGSLETYVSKKIKEPTKILNDGIFTNDHIKVSDKSFFFTTSWIAFNFSALKESRFNVSISFGHKTLVKNKRTVPNSIPENKILLNINEKPKKLKHSKDFIKLNRTLECFTKPVVNKKDQELKRNIVKERHRNIQFDIQEKRKILVKKQEIRLEAEIKGLEILDIIRRKQNFEKFWLVLAQLGNSLIVIRKTMATTRFERLKRLKSSFAARKIQTKYKQRLKKIPVEIRASFYSFFSVIFFQKHCRFLIKIKNKSLISCIKQSFSNSKVCLTFSGFFKKVNLIQDTFRNYQLENEIRLEELEVLWNEVVLTKIDAINAHKKKTKKWKKKMIEKYSSITLELKTKTIYEYLRAAKKTFLKQFRDYAEKSNKKKNLKPSKFDNKFLNLIYPPMFKYYPSNKEMGDLIDSILTTENNEDT